MEETVSLGSHQVTRIQVFHGARHGFLGGLVFFTGEEEIARIGWTDPDWATTTIQLAQGERWVGVSSGEDNGLMTNF